MQCYVNIVILIIHVDIITTFLSLHFLILSLDHQVNYFTNLQI